jgi:hypothetical protein
MAEELTEKQKIIKEIYYNRISGFGSISDTLKQAKEKDVNITYNDVKQYLDSLKHRQTHFKSNKYNTFVSMGPLYEIEIDIMDMTIEATEDDGYRYGLVGIDNFTKIAHVTPIKTKTPKDVINALDEKIKKYRKTKTNIFRSGRKFYK